MSRERAELSKKNPYHIPRYRYYELKYFCRQYDDWKKAPLHVPPFFCWL